MDASTGDNLSKEGELTDTSVLDLDVTKTVESLLVGIIEKSQRIEESKRRLGTELVLEGGEGGCGLAGLGRGKGGSAGDKGGNDSRLHGMLFMVESDVDVYDQTNYEHFGFCFFANGPWMDVACGVVSWDLQPKNEHVDGNLEVRFGLGLDFGSNLSIPTYGRSRTGLICFPQPFETAV